MLNADAELISARKARSWFVRHPALYETFDVRPSVFDEWWSTT